MSSNTRLAEVGESIFKVSSASAVYIAVDSTTNVGSIVITGLPGGFANYKSIEDGEISMAVDGQVKIDGRFEYIKVTPSDMASPYDVSVAQ